jgi:hypothetical protein
MSLRVWCVAATLAACAEAEAPLASTSFSLRLTSETAAKVSQFQVALLRRDSVDCGDLAASCVKGLGLATVPLADGAPALWVPYEAGQSSAALSLEVDAGTYAVVVEALDASGLVVANACRLNIALVEGESQTVPMELAVFAGTCDGLLSP